MIPVVDDQEASSLTVDPSLNMLRDVNFPQRQLPIMLTTSSTSSIANLAEKVISPE